MKAPTKQQEQTDQFEGIYRENARPRKRTGGFAGALQRRSNPSFEPAEQDATPENEMRPDERTKPARPPRDGIYRFILGVMLFDLALGIVLAAAGATVLASREVAFTGLGLAAIGGALFFFFRMLGRREAERRRAPPP